MDYIYTKGTFINFDIALGLCDQWHLDRLREKLKEVRYHYGQHIPSTKTDTVMGSLESFDEYFKIRLDQQCLVFVRIKDNMINMKHILNAAGFAKNEADKVSREEHRFNEYEYVVDYPRRLKGIYIDILSTLKLYKQLNLDTILKLLTSSGY